MARKRGPMSDAQRQAIREGQERNQALRDADALARGEVPAAPARRGNTSPRGPMSEEQKQAIREGAARNRALRAADKEAREQGEEHGGVGE